MILRCKNCKKIISQDEKELLEKSNLVCSECGSDMEEVTSYPFTVNDKDGRIVSEFEVNAIDEEEADTLAQEKYDSFITDLHFERQ